MILFLQSIVSLVSQGDGFIEVTREARNVRLALHLRFQTSTSQVGTSVRPKPYRKNTIPVITSGVDEKFKSWRKLMGKLRQYHSSLKISTIKEPPKDGFLAIGDSLQDVTILQNEKEMKAALGKNVNISLPKAFQISKEETKVLQLKESQLI